MVSGVGPQHVAVCTPVHVSHERSVALDEQDQNIALHTFSFGRKTAFSAFIF